MSEVLLCLLHDHRPDGRRELEAVRRDGLQGYLAYKKHPPSRKDPKVGLKLGFHVGPREGGCFP